MGVVETFLEKGILVDSEILADASLKSRLLDLTDEDIKNIDIIDKEFLENVLTLKESSSLSDTSVGRVKIVFSYNKKPKKISVADFVNHFTKRYEILSSMLRQRPELQNSISISRISLKNDKEKVSLIGLVYEKSTTKTGKFVLTMEDPSGMITVIVSDRNQETHKIAGDVVLDEVIGIEGVLLGKTVFANRIFSPEVPMTKELKKSPVDESIALLGDPHFGSNVFMKTEFEDFIEWINQRKGSPQQKELASKVKYVVFPGDLVEGIGVYPGQEKDLDIRNIEEQYDIMANYLKKIPSHIKIIICPGNHDVGRIAEPQPAITHHFAHSLIELPNVILVSNPAMVNIGATEQFPGFDMLIYHGFSLIYYANNVESLRNAGGQKRSDLIMQFLLKKRHLAPAHTSNRYVPDGESDALIIKKIPDFFVTGHIHRVAVSNYKNITLANGSCWTEITEDQEKRGLQPQPAKVPIFDLKTRSVKVMNFLKPKKEKLEEEKRE